MFAFVVWDRIEKTLTLRGTATESEPLYIAETSEGLTFGSEQKAILARPGTSVMSIWRLYWNILRSRMFTNRTLARH